MKHPLSIMLTALILMLKCDLALCQSQQTDPVLSPQAQEVKTQVEKIKIGGNVTVTLVSGNKFYGSIVSIGADKFDVAEVDLQQIIPVKYDDTKKVSRGYGKKNIWGKRINPRTSLIVGIAVIGGIFGLAIWGASQTR